MKIVRIALTNRFHERLLSPRSTKPNYTALVRKKLSEHLGLARTMATKVKGWVEKYTRGETSNVTTFPLMEYCY